MNTQFQPCVQYKRTFNVTEDHDNHKLVVNYARNTNQSAGKKDIRRVQNLEVEEVLYMYNLFVDTCNDLGMSTNRWYTQWGQCLSRGPRKRWNETLANRPIEHTKEGFKATIQAYIKIITPDPDAKGTMIAAFVHQHMAKPMEQRKRMFFKTHPRSWQDAYMDMAVNFREASILQIRDYMTRKKDSADKTRKQDKKNKQQGYGEPAEAEDLEEEEVPEGETAENAGITHKEITRGTNVISIQRTRPRIHNMLDPTTTALIQEATRPPNLVTVSLEDEEGSEAAEDLEAEEDLEAKEPEEDPTTKAITTRSNRAKEEMPSPTERQVMPGPRATEAGPQATANRREAKIQIGQDAIGTAGPRATKRDTVGPRATAPFKHPSKNYKALHEVRQLDEIFVQQRRNTQRSPKAEIFNRVEILGGTPRRDIRAATTKYSRKGEDDANRVRNKTHQQAAGWLTRDTRAQRRDTRDRKLAEEIFGRQDEILQLDIGHSENAVGTINNTTMNEGFPESGIEIAFSAASTSEEEEESSVLSSSSRSTSASESDNEADNDTKKKYKYKMVVYTDSQVPKLAKGGEGKVEDWYQQFEAYADKHKYGEMLSAKAHKDLPPKGLLPPQEELSKAQKKALKKHNAFSDNSTGLVVMEKSKLNRDGIPETNAKLQKQWPCCRVHRVVEELMREQLNQDLRNLKLSAGTPPLELITSIYDLQRKYQYKLVSPALDELCVAFKAALPPYLVQAKGDRAKEMSLFGAEMTNVGNTDKRNKWAKNAVCYWCQEKGHKTYQCEKRKAGEPRVDKKANNNNNNNNNSNNNSSGKSNGQKGGTPAKCGKCGGRHKETNCWEDEKNASKRPAGWTSKFKDVQGATIDYDFCLTALTALQIWIPSVHLLPEGFDLLYDDNVFVFDTGATSHSSNSMQCATNLRDSGATITTQSGNELKGCKIGDIPCQKMDKDGNWEFQTLLQGVNFNPDFAFNLFSANLALKNGWIATGSDKTGWSLQKGSTMVNFDIQIPTYTSFVWVGYFQRMEASGQDISAATATTTTSEGIEMSIDKAHRLLGHMNEPKTRQTAEALGWTITWGAMTPCEDCAKAKAKRKVISTETVTIDGKTLPKIQHFSGRVPVFHAHLQTFSKAVGRDLDYQADFLDYDTLDFPLNKPTTAQPSILQTKTTRTASTQHRVQFQGASGGATTVPIPLQPESDTNHANATDADEKDDIEEAKIEYDDDDDDIKETKIKYDSADYDSNQDTIKGDTEGNTEEQQDSIESVEDDEEDQHVVTTTRYGHVLRNSHLNPDMQYGDMASYAALFTEAEIQFHKAMAELQEFNLLSVSVPSPECATSDLSPTSCECL
eukprot:jgi/Psemu1/42207/gm1.42207_g